jgi:hypothetical protein
MPNQHVPSIRESVGQKSYQRHPMLQHQLYRFVLELDRESPLSLLTHPRPLPNLHLGGRGSGKGYCSLVAPEQRHRTTNPGVNQGWFLPQRIDLPTGARPRFLALAVVRRYRLEFSQRDR